MKNDFLTTKKKDTSIFADHVEFFKFKNLNLFYVVNNTDDSSGDLLVSFFSGDLVFEILEKDRLFTNSFFLISKNSSTLLTGNHNFHDLSLKLKSQVAEKGAVEHEISKTKFLLAYVRYPMDNFIIISSMPSAKAFEVTQSLILKTVFFAFSLLGFAVALGILFSITITRPINILTEAAKKISIGDFDVVTKVKSNDELKILSVTFDFMAKEIKSLLNIKEAMIDELNLANIKLEDYSKNLEFMVADRTAELKEANDFMGAMVNSLDQGLIVFDKDLNCNDIFTHASIDLFGKSPKDLTYSELLAVDGKNETNNLKDWAKITFSGLLDFDSAVGLIPKVKKWGKDYKDKHFKQIDIEYFPMKDGDILKNIVAVATEKTKEIQSKELSKEKEQYVAMILKVLANKVQFSAFLKEVNIIFDQFSNKSFSLNDTLEFKSYLEFCMMQFHTLNGGFSLYSILHLQKLARSCEDEIALLVDSDLGHDIILSRIHLLVIDLKNELSVFLNDLDKTLGLSFSSGSLSVEISRNSIIKIKSLIDLSSQPELKEIFYEDFINEPVSNYFLIYEDLVQQTAKVLGKKINPILFYNIDTRIQCEKYSEFFNSLVHLFRNCVDHGIESPDSRQANGKSDFGSIKISFFKDNFQFVLSVEDDGAGINPELIRKKLIQLDKTNDYSHVSDDEVIQQIFSPFFSTKDVLTATSGRGVGMSVIKEIVDRMNGEILIRTKVGEGSQFNFIFSQIT